MDDSEPDSLIHAGRTVPIYRTTSGLSVRYLRSMMKTIIDSCCGTMPDILPAPIIKNTHCCPRPKPSRRFTFLNTKRTSPC